MAEAELYNRCCRLCLSDKTDTLKSVFGETELNVELREKILAYLSVDIKMEDRLSTNICEVCLVKVNDWSDFKKTCTSNQAIIEAWADRMQDIHSMTIQIKEEVIDPDISMQDDEIEIINSNFSRVKAEPIDYDSCNENNSQSSRASLFKCRWCDADFEDKEAHNDHEKKEHGIMAEGSVEEMETNNPISADPNHTEKIEFAAGLRLIQSNSTPITMESLSRIEMSYIEKCKAMVVMYRTLICACHNASHPNLKGLLSHLRGLRIWFPVFTCYHCMITFTDRSSSGKHHHKCPKKDLDTLVKLSNLKKRSALKTRLYQNYKCVKCKFMFSFHDDFCKHVDEHHVEGNPPYFCSCLQSFDRIEDFKDHIYVSCMVEYYCDICFVCVKTLKDFIQHAEENHDNSEGFVLLQDDNYKQRSFSKVEPRENKEILGKRRSSTYGRAPPVLKPEIMDCEVEENVSTKVVSSRNLPTKCPLCDKIYSCQANMLRHYRTHVKKNNEETMTNGNYATDNSLYQCPDCHIMFNAKDWEEHKESHDQKKCLECNKIFLFQTELELHRSVHLNLKVYRDAKTHSYKTTMLSPNSETPVCDICGIVCENFDDLESHKLSHEDLDDNCESDPSSAKYSCMPCNKHYTGYSGLWEHNKKKHSDKQTTNNQTYPRQCDECEKVITSGSAFASHKQMHRRVREETARMASHPNSPEETPTRRARKSGTQDDEDYFTCKRCFKVFSSKYNLRMHMKLHGINMISTKTNKQNKKFSCDLCNISFPNADALRIHNEEDHDDMPDLVSVIEEFTNKPYIFTCDICVQTFSTKEALKQHKENHASEGGASKQFTNKVATYCKYCKIPFETIQLLDEHMLTQHEELPKPSKLLKSTTTKPYACKICKKTFVSPAAMYAHQGWHKRLKNEALLKAAKTKKPQSTPIKQDKPEFVCSHCNLELPNDTALKVHVLEKHGNMAAYLTPRCETCNQEFATISEYENHKKLHEIVEFQKKLVTYPCQYCSASFNKDETLQSHIRLSHSEAYQEYKCGHCGRVFDKQASLTNHVKVHEKQKAVVGTPKPLYFCSICNMGFHIPKELRTHTITAHPF
ncbi:hypothetical protein WA026_012000 [Henosepilachna vigintioctopunctata]|uniref:Uncharacterized protein n=1 Tax=Henosepilachna vigintioctopunctata TaxID=420089 RepID=A0AAW1VAL5_9CUCU